jgi:hydroxymethylglutaryl-CoA reductase (NADPH)
MPRDPDNDWTDELAAARRRFVLEQTGAELAHVGHYSFDPHL